MKFESKSSPASKSARVEARHDDAQSIVASLKPYLWKAASKLHRPATWEIDDLVQIGLLAAFECRDKFDPERGKFQAFAGTVALRAMFDACAENRGVVRLPAVSASRDEARGVRIKTWSLDKPLEAGDDVCVSTHYDLYPVDSTTENDAAINEALRRMKPTHRSIFLRLASGEYLRDIAHSEGVSHQAIYERCQVARRHAGIDTSGIEK